MYDLIIVPGGGLDASGLLYPWVRARFDRALEIRASEPILCLSAGTLHKPPPLDQDGRPVFEAAAGARYLLERGVEPSAILTEAASWDTIGNAYFARVMHTDVRGWPRLLVVNSQFHMARTEFIFRWVFSLAPGRSYELAFEEADDRSLPPLDRQYRERHEQARLAVTQSLSERIHSMVQMHEFLFHEHDAYSAAGLTKTREPEPEELLRGY